MTNSPIGYNTAVGEIISAGEFNRDADMVQRIPNPSLRQFILFDAGENQDVPGLWDGFHMLFSWHAVEQAVKDYSYSLHVEAYGGVYPGGKRSRRSLGARPAPKKERPDRGAYQRVKRWEAQLPKRYHRIIHPPSD